MSDADAKIVDMPETPAEADPPVDEEESSLPAVGEGNNGELTAEAAAEIPDHLTAGQLYVVRTTKELLVFIGTFELSELIQKMSRSRNDFLRFVDGVVRTDEVVYIKSYPAFLLQQMIGSGKPVDSWTAQLLFNEFVSFETDEEPSPEAALDPAGYRDRA